ncbi:hypothetical protein D3C71_1553100 [compost metagenome]
MELKVAKELVRTPQVRVEITVHQVFFATKRWGVGGNAWILLRVGQGPRREHFLVPGDRSGLLHNRAVDLAWLREVSAAPPTSTAAELMLAAGRARAPFP